MVLSAQARMWQIELPEDAAYVLARTDVRFGSLGTSTTQPPQHGHLTSAALQSARTIREQNPTDSRQQGGTHQQHTRSEVQSAVYSSAPMRDSNYSMKFPLAAELAAQGDQSSSGLSTQQMAYGMIADLRGNTLPEEQRFGTQQAPTTSQPSRKRRLPSTADTSSMFGGVEALLREGQDWWMKDQSQIALGFDNWSYTTTEGWSQRQRSKQSREEQQTEH